MDAVSASVGRWLGRKEKKKEGRYGAAVFAHHVHHTIKWLWKQVLIEVGIVSRWEQWKRWDLERGKKRKERKEGGR